MVERICGAGSDVLETPGPSCRDLTSDFAKTCQVFARSIYFISRDIGTVGIGLLSGIHVS